MGAEPPRRRSRSAENQDLWKSTEWRMMHMKVAPCHKRYAHDWSTCPFGHDRTAARRRDPRLYPHTGIACPSMKQDGRCPLGDACPYAHNVFEYWLHPTRYRTQLCNDGASCKRWLCFFAHSMDELRVPECKPWMPSGDAAVEEEAAAAAAAAAPGALSRASSASPGPFGMQHAQHAQRAQQADPFGFASLQGLPGPEGRARQSPPSRLGLQQQQQRQHRPSLDMALPSPAEVAAHQALAAALQQPPAHHQQQSGASVLDLVMDMLHRGAASADHSAALLHGLAPQTHKAGRLQTRPAAPGARDGSCAYMGHAAGLAGQPQAAGHQPYRGGVANLASFQNNLGWAPAASHAMHAAPAASLLSGHPDVALGPLLDHLAALQLSAAAGGSGAHLTPGSAAAQLATFGGGAFEEGTPLPEGRLLSALDGRQSSLESAPSSLAELAASSGGTSPSHASLADAACDPDGSAFAAASLQDLRQKQCQEQVSGLAGLPALCLGSFGTAQGPPVWTW